MAKMTPLPVWQGDRVIIEAIVGGTMVRVEREFVHEALDELMDALESLGFSREMLGRLLTT